MKKSYQNVGREDGRGQDRSDCRIIDHRESRALTEFLSGERRLLLSMLELLEQAEMAVDELIDVVGRATIEAVLVLSAQKLAGPKHPGMATDGAIGRHGEQSGRHRLWVIDGSPCWHHR